jgi:hypothetical protein
MRNSLHHRTDDTNPQQRSPNCVGQSLQTAFRRVLNTAWLLEDLARLKSLVESGAPRLEIMRGTRRWRNIRAKITQLYGNLPYIKGVIPRILAMRSRYALKHKVLYEPNSPQFPVMSYLTRQRIFRRNKTTLKSTATKIKGF